MSFTRFDELPEAEPAPGFRGRFVHSETMTAARWDELLAQMTALDPSLAGTVKATDCYTLEFLP